MATDKAGGVSNEAVLKATGHTWDEWFALLDGEKASTLSHPAIAILVSERFGASDWWSQMVTVAYEQARGLRDKHQKSDGYAISQSKTVNAPIEALYNAWVDDETRQKWLPDAPLEIRKATERKSVRMAWDGSASAVDALFSAKGDSKSQVSVQHSKLADAEAAAAIKAYWAEALVHLKEFLEA
jgi:uncharacterized protein YndB with AHSA1/START domain